MGPVDITHEQFREHVRRGLPSDVRTIVVTDAHEIDNVVTVSHRVSLFCGGCVDESSARFTGPTAIGVVSQLAAFLDALYLTGMDLEDWRSENGLCPRCGEEVEGTCGACFGGRGNDGPTREDFEHDYRESFRESAP